MIALDTKDRYLNRELSALAFNERVLDEGMQPSLPLLERLKFLGIVSSNLDEFFMVRMASLAPNDPTRRGACESARRLLKRQETYFLQDEVELGSCHPRSPPPSLSLPPSLS